MSQVITTKEELKEAQKQGLDNFIVRGELADKISKTKKVFTLGPVALGGLIAAFTGATVAAPFTGGVSYAPVAGLSSTTIGAVAIIVSAIGATTYFALVKDYNIKVKGKSELGEVEVEFTKNELNIKNDNSWINCRVLNNGCIIQIYSDGRTFQIIDNSGKKLIKGSSQDIKNYIVDNMPECKGILYPGDILAVKRFNGIYSHFAVYIGEGKVIHFAATDGDFKGGDITIHEAPFSEFLKNDKDFMILDFSKINLNKKNKLARSIRGLLSSKKIVLAVLNPITLGTASVGVVIPLLSSASIFCLEKLFERLRKEDSTEIRIYSPDETVARAKSLCNSNKKYNLFNGNCEHFAIWCKTGVWKSMQVEQVLEFFHTITYSVIS